MAPRCSFSVDAHSRDLPRAPLGPHSAWFAVAIFKIYPCIAHSSANWTPKPVLKTYLYGPWLPIRGLQRWQTPEVLVAVLGQKLHLISWRSARCKIWVATAIQPLILFFSKKGGKVFLDGLLWNECSTAHFIMPGHLMFFCYLQDYIWFNKKAAFCHSKLLGAYWFVYDWAKYGETPLNWLSGLG